MNIKYFDKARMKAREQVQNKGYLQAKEHYELISIAQNNDKISVETENTFKILLEIQCAFFTSNIWKKNSVSHFTNMPILYLQYAKSCLQNRSSKENQKILHKIFITMTLLSEAIGSHEFNDDKPSIFFSDNIACEEKKLKTHASFQAFVAASLAIAIGGIPLAPDQQGNSEKEPTDYSATECSIEATDLTPKEFWTWYIDVAFPQALAEVPKYLNRAEG